MLGAVGGGSSAPPLRACQQQKLTQRPGALRQLQDPGSLQSGQFQGASLEDLDHLTPGKQEGQKNRGVCVQNMQVIVESLSHV